MNSRYDFFTNINFMEIKYDVSLDQSALAQLVSVVVRVTTSVCCCTCDMALL